LGADLAAWFDSEIWKQQGKHEFRDPVDANLLLEAAPEVIWPGLMPCDLLPVLGNTAGDWLCVRFDQGNRAAEVVQWYHGGGDWLPWGRSISDAVLFDVLSQRLPSPARRHAIPAESTRPQDTSGRDPILDWACRRTAAEVVELLACQPSEDAQAHTDTAASQSTIVQTLLDHGVAEIAVRCELVQSSLRETLSASLNPQTAQRMGVQWNDVVQWMFDVQRMPEQTRQRLEREFGLTITKPQDWESAEQHSRRVVELAPDLAWAWDVIGYACERNGKRDAAIQAYQKASQCSVFTDQSVRLRTHWTADHAAKFSASRLGASYPEVVQDSAYLQILCDPDAQTRRHRLTQYWLEQADASSQAGHWHAAHRQYVAAGWDLGSEPLSLYGGLLEKIADAADRSGQTARAELARTHRRCLRERYGA
jgi:hypothetical protein